MNPPLSRCLCITLIVVYLSYCCCGSFVLPLRVEYENDGSINSRVAPVINSQQPYTITKARLNDLNNELMYWYFDQGGIDDEGDFLRNIHSSSPQISKDLNFQLPFFGFRFNYTRISMHGFLEFTDPPKGPLTYPLVFPNKDWPKENDQSFIGIFHSRMRIGDIFQTDVDQRRPGVYFRLENNLQTRTDQLGVEMRERLTWDLRTGIKSAEAFKPKHAVIVTWKNMSFAGGIDDALYVTNTFQIVLATDEVSTYAIFNYRDLQWTSHTEAGGDTSTGSGGISAFVGFNAGNGKDSFEYLPYSQHPTIRDLTKSSLGSNIKGRHIFKINEHPLFTN